jgi:hypothetical protein
MREKTKVYRIIDRDQAQRTLDTLELTVEEYREMHKNDNGISARLARINVLKMMLSKPVVKGELV